MGMNQVVDKSLAELPALQIDGLAGTSISVQASVPERSWCGNVGEAITILNTTTAILDSLKASSTPMENMNRMNAAAAVKNTVLRMAGVSTLSELLAAM